MHLHFIVVHDLQGAKMAIRVNDIRGVFELPSSTRIKTGTEQIECVESFERVLNAMQNIQSNQPEEN